MIRIRHVLLFFVLCLVLLSSACGGCEGVRSRACCTEGHSGEVGDCEDMIVSHRYDQCAFVDDIHGCKPPREWTQRPNGWSAGDWLCPAGYEWIDDLDCAGEESSAATTAEDSGGIEIPCLGTLLVGPALLVFWLAIRRTA